MKTSHVMKMVLAGSILSVGMLFSLTGTDVTLSAQAGAAAPQGRGAAPQGDV